jgi:hypothetical protein
MRLISVTKGSEELGFYACLFFLISLGCDGLFSSPFSALLQIIGILTIIASGNRVSAVLLIISFVILGFGRARSIFHSIFKGIGTLYATLFLIAVLGFVSFTFENVNVFGIQLFSSIKRVIHSGIDIFNSSRSNDIWPFYLNLIWENPLGIIGYPTFSQLPYKYYPHNIFLFITSFGGFIAGFLFILWLANCCLRMMPGGPKLALRFSLGLAIMAHLMKVDPIRTPSALSFYVVLMTIMAAVLNTLRKNKISPII